MAFLHDLSMSCILSVYRNEEQQSDQYVSYGCHYVVVSMGKFDYAYLANHISFFDKKVHLEL
jgi:hypothetical protein